MTANESTRRKLPLSHLIYKDDEIDSAKASKLIVYHYPLNKSYRWKEWESHLDHELDSRQFAYLMKSHRGQFGLFVALKNETDYPPKITNADGIELRPERVHYAQEMGALNPIWIRLIMRQLSAFDNHCKGSYSLGRPLLKVDVWKSKKSSGINAISLDCRTQQLRDKNTTEIILFHENVLLRPIVASEELASSNSPLWVYDKKNVLVRWYCHKDKRLAGVPYKEIRKQKNTRKQRAFLDVSSPKKFLESWPMVLKPIQDEFIKYAKNFGFNLSPKILNLIPLKTNTKYKSLKNEPAFHSVMIEGIINVIDLRVGQLVPAQKLLNSYADLLEKKGIKITFNLQADITADSIQEYRIDQCDRLLILLDQRPGIDNDRYHLSFKLRGLGAVQHINTNPYDILEDPIEAGYLIESIDVSGKTTLYPDNNNHYYSYRLEEVTQDDYQSVILRNLEIGLKELDLKRLLLCKQATISKTLPYQKACLNAQILVIVDGFLFTVFNDRPVLVPFNPTDEALVFECNRWLSKFETSVIGLIETLHVNWPYSYPPQDVMDSFGSDFQKRRRFAERLTIVLFKDVSGSVSITLQDPRHDTPHMLPEGLDDVYADLSKKTCTYPLHSWALPNVDVLNALVMELVANSEITDTKAKRLRGELGELKELWDSQLTKLFQEKTHDSDYKTIKKAVFDQWLYHQEKRNDSSLIGAWDSLMSRYFDKPLKDIRGWLRSVPGIQKLWFDPEQQYFIVGSLSSPKTQLQRQPSIRQWHAIQGKLDVDLLSDLIDVDWVRMNQLAGNPCISTLVKRWKECHLGDVMLIPLD